MNMYHSYQASQYQAPQCDPEADAKVLRAAMKGCGTDELAIISIIGKRSNDQRQQIKLYYKTAFGRDLIEDLRDELGGDFETLAVALFDTSIDYDCKELRTAMKGAGTDEETLIEIIGSRDNQRLTEIKKQYRVLFNRSLEDDIVDETSSDLQKLLVSLLQCNRDENMNPDEKQCEADANELFEAGEGQWGTEESTFNRVFSLRSKAEMNCIWQMYQHKSGKTILQSLENEFSGDILKLYVTIINSSINPPFYFASRINYAVKGCGTYDNILIRVLVSRDEIDLPQIKHMYLANYGHSVEDAINEDTSGDYKRLLIALVKD